MSVVEIIARPPYAEMRDRASSSREPDQAFRQVLCDYLARHAHSPGADLAGPSDLPSFVHLRGTLLEGGLLYRCAQKRNSRRAVSRGMHGSTAWVRKGGGRTSENNGYGDPEKKSCHEAPVRYATQGVVSFPPQL